MLSVLAAMVPSYKEYTISLSDVSIFRISAKIIQIISYIINKCYCNRLTKNIFNYGRLASIISLHDFGIIC